MFKLSFHELVRTPVKSCVIILIFASSFSLLCFSVNYYNYVQNNILDIEASFTTIAFLDTQAMDSITSDSNLINNANSLYDNIPESDFYLSLRNFVSTSQFGRIENCELLRGVSDSIYPSLSGAEDPLNYSTDEDTPRNTATFIVTALEADYKPNLDLNDASFKKLSIFSGGGTMDSAHYVIKFRINETIVLNPSYHPPEYVYVSSGAFTTNLKCPFEYGKQYIISGVYCDVQVIQKERDNGTPFPDIYMDFDESSVPSMYLDGSNFITYTNIVSEREIPVIKDCKIDGVSTKAYTYSDNELSQMCISYNGDLNELLAIRPDLEQRLNNAVINAHSIEVRTTNNLYSVPFFNQGKASIMSGRNFTDEEIISGAPVCVVSESFATFNHLKVGDSFNVDLYNSIMRKQGGSKWEMTRYHDPDNPSYHEREITRGSLLLEIVGIYISQSDHSSAYELYDSTIFIPVNSVPVSYIYKIPDKTRDLENREAIYFSNHSPHMIPALNYIVIPNDKIADFKAEAEEAGFGQYFIYNDQGYSQIKDTLPYIAGSTQIFVLSAFLGFIAMYSLYLTLLWRKGYDLGMLLSLGAKRIDVVLHALIKWSFTIISALILAFIIVTFTSAPLAMAAIKSTMDQFQSSNAFSAGSQENTMDLTDKFSTWVNDYIATTCILLAVLILYLTTVIICKSLQSKHPVLKLLRRCND